MSKLLISLFLTIFLIYDTNCGIVSWFKSIGKPEWYPKIENPPLIEAFQPKGLRVSIADIDGLELIKFHGNLNNDPIVMEKVIKQKSNGRWWYVNEDIVLHIGDKLKYWIYVQVNDEGLLFSQETHKIQNLIPSPSSLYVSGDQSSNNIEWSIATVEQLCPCKNKTSDIPGEHIKLTKNEYNALNYAIVQQNADLDFVHKLIKENMKNNTKLLFIDKKSVNDTNISNLKSIFEDQLYLQNFYEQFSFEATPCGALLDTTSTIGKMQVLIAASKFLKNSSLEFVEPTESNCLYENNYFIHKKP